MFAACFGGLEMGFWKFQRFDSWMSKDFPIPVKNANKNGLSDQKKNKQSRLPRNLSDMDLGQNPTRTPVKIQLQKDSIRRVFPSQKTSGRFSHIAIVYLP